VSKTATCGTSESSCDAASRMAGWPDCEGRQIRELGKERPDLPRHLHGPDEPGSAVDEAMSHGVDGNHLRVGRDAGADLLDNPPGGRGESAGIRYEGLVERLPDPGALIDRVQQAVLEAAGSGVEDEDARASGPGIRVSLRVASVRLRSRHRAFVSRRPARNPPRCRPSCCGRSARRPNASFQPPACRLRASECSRDARHA